MSYYYLMVETRTGRIFSGFAYGATRKEAKANLKARYGSLKGLQIIRFK